MRSLLSVWMWMMKALRGEHKLPCRRLNASGAKARSLAKILKNILKGIPITKRAMIVASYIANSVDAASKVNPGPHFLQRIQLARQLSANESQNANGANAQRHHAFITGKK